MVFPEICETDPSKQFLTYIWKKSKIVPKMSFYFFFPGRLDNAYSFLLHHVCGYICVYMNPIDICTSHTKYILTVDFKSHRFH